MPKPFTEKAKMRVEVARDVIAALNSKRIIADSTYMRVHKHHDADYYKQFPEVTLNKKKREKLNNQYRTPKLCQACGVGALFIAAVDRFDKLQVKDLYTVNSFHGYTVTPELDVPDMVPYLEKWFSTRQLALIEIAFEGDEIGDIDDPSEAATERAKRFHSRMSRQHTELNPLTRPSGPEYTMRQIMENIIKHRGEFRP